MGASGSKSRGLWLFGSGGPGGSERSTGDQTLARARGLCSATPFVFTRRGSMYYDEDGDLAHEFYEETIITKNGRKRAKLKRIHKNLIPQGMVKLEHPRIHVDFPVIICELLIDAYGAADVKCLDTRGPTCTFLGTDILHDYPSQLLQKLITDISAYFFQDESREGNVIAVKREHPADRDEFANLLDQHILPSQHDGPP